MSFWNTLMGWLGVDASMEASSCSNSPSENHGCPVNPASSLPMADGCSGLDVAGNPFGVDLHHDTWSPISDSFSDSTWSSPGFDSSPTWDGGWTGSSWDD